MRQVRRHTNTETDPGSIHTQAVTVARNRPNGGFYTGNDRSSDEQRQVVT